MKQPEKISLTSIKELLGRFFRMLSGPTFFMTLRRIDPVFREKLLLTVSMSNECGG